MFAQFTFENAGLKLTLCNDMESEREKIACANSLSPKTHHLGDNTKMTWESRASIFIYPHPFK